MRISITEAKKRLPKLLKVVEDGEEITICRRGMPVAGLVRSKIGKKEQ